MARVLCLSVNLGLICWLLVGLVLHLNILMLALDLMGKLVLLLCIHLALWVLLLAYRLGLVLGLRLLEHITLGLSVHMI